MCKGGVNLQSLTMRNLLPILKITILLCSLPFSGLCQEKKYTSSFLFKFDNDYLNIKMKGSDRFYTCGILLEYTSQVKRRTIFDRIAIAPSDSSFRIRTISLDHQTYTPKHIGNSKVQIGDYPYAGLIVINYGNKFLEKDYSFTSILTLGIQGKAALSCEVQSFLHQKVFHSNTPLGWKYQLPNDIAMCYTFSFDKRIFAVQHAEVLGNATLQVGTLHNTFSLGGYFRFGRFYSFFDPRSLLFTRDKRSVKRQVYITIEPYLKFVQGNSLLEGGPTNSPGPAWGKPGSKYYHINRDQMERIVYGYSWALCYVSRWFSVAFQQHLQSAEIKGLPAHEYASVKLGVKL